MSTASKNTEAGAAVPAQAEQASSNVAGAAASAEAENEEDADDAVSITLITGYLGAGKTTLLTRILTENHGLRLAVIQNEFGEVGIDDALVKEKTKLFGAEEQNFCMELQNGCICCTVRTDLAKAIQGMVQAHLAGKKIDGILIETTGVADPGPVVQTLFADSYLKQMTYLDGILTVVDSKHILQHLKKGGAEAVTQVAYADHIILNKTDLVTPDELASVQLEIRKLNGSAKVSTCTHAKVPVSSLLGIKSFVLGRIEAIEEEAQFAELHKAAAAAHSHHGHGHSHGCTDEGCSKDHCAEEGCGGSGGEGHGHGHSHSHSNCHDDANCSDESHSGIIRAGVHDSKVNSCGIICPGEVDYEVLSYWLGGFLQEHGTDVYRMKGLLAVQGHDSAYILQGVHELWDLAEGKPWGDRPRVNKFVFIGKDLNKDELREEFQSCIVGTDGYKELRAALEEEWANEDDDTQEGDEDDEYVPYEVTVHNGMHGLGLVLTEVVPGSVFVTKFTTFPGDAVNPAQQEGRIRLGDQIIGLNDVPVMGWPLSRIISEVQKVPRGVGESGAMVKLAFLTPMEFAGRLGYDGLGEQDDDDDDEAEDDAGAPQLPSAATDASQNRAAALAAAGEAAVAAAVADGSRSLATAEEAQEDGSIVKKPRTGI